MDQLFIIRIVISFFIAGIWIGSATFLAERLGSKWGGLFTNLPSNILISMIFVAIVNDINFVVETVPAVPLGMAIDTIFLFVFVILLRYSVTLSALVSLSVWFILALLATLTNFNHLLINILVYFCITILAFILLEKFIKIPSMPKSDKKYSTIQIIIRMIFAGAVVATVIVISKFFSPFIVGIFSTFPAVLLSSMVILALNQNKQFAQATGKIMVLSSTNIVVYSISVYFTFPLLGLVTGTIISFIIAVIWVLLFGPLLRKLS